MKTFFIIMASILIVYLSLWMLAKLAKKNKEKNVKEQTKKILSQYGHVYENNKQLWFDYNEKTYELIFQYIPVNREFSINSPTTWQVYTTPSTFIDQAKLVLTKHLKIVVIYPNEEKIKRYINESDIEFVRFKQVYTYYPVLFKDLETFITEL